MSRIFFTVKYKIKNEAYEEYRKIAKELKLVVKAEGLLQYDILKLKGNNEFCEIFLFENEEAYENYDDTNELLSALLSKLSDLIEEGSIEYSTYEDFIVE